MISKTQMRVLCEMAETNLPLKLALGTPPSIWVTLCYEAEYRYRVTTFSALLDKGLISRCDSDNTPWYRKDYILTGKGRRAVLNELNERNGE